MYSRKRQREWGDSGGWQVSRRRNNGYYISHEQNQQSPSPFQNPVAHSAKPGEMMGGANHSGKGNNVEDSFEFHDDTEEESCCEKLQCLLVFGTVGVCVLMLFPDFVNSIRDQFFDAEEPPTMVSSVVYVASGVCMWLYMSSIALLVFYSFSKTTN